MNENTSNQINQSINPRLIRSSDELINQSIDRSSNLLIDQAINQSILRENRQNKIYPTHRLSRDNVLLFLLVKPRDSFDRQIIRFSRAARKNNLLRIRTDQRSNLSPGRLHRYFAFPPVSMTPGVRISEMAQQIRQHRVEHTWIHGSRGLLIQVQRGNVGQFLLHFLVDILVRGLGNLSNLLLESRTGFLRFRPGVFRFKFDGRGGGLAHSWRRGNAPRWLSLQWLDKSPYIPYLSWKHCSSKLLKCDRKSRMIIAIIITWNIFCGHLNCDFLKELSIRMRNRDGQKARYSYVLSTVCEAHFRQPPFRVGVRHHHPVPRACGMGVNENIMFRSHERAIASISWNFSGISKFPIFSGLFYVKEPIFGTTRIGKRIRENIVTSWSFPASGQRIEHWDCNQPSSRTNRPFSPLSTRLYGSSFSQRLNFSIALLSKSAMIRVKSSIFCDQKEKWETRNSSVSFFFLTGDFPRSFRGVCRGRGISACHGWRMRPPQNRWAFYGVSSSLDRLGVSIFWKRSCFRWMCATPWTRPWTMSWPETTLCISWERRSRNTTAHTKYDLTNDGCFV